MKVDTSWLPAAFLGCSVQIVESLSSVMRILVGVNGLQIPRDARRFTGHGVYGIYNKTLSIAKARVGHSTLDGLHLARLTGVSREGQ